MELLPAVDIRGEQAVRLSQGDFRRATEYGDPLALGKSYVAAGARWVHVVDLEAARTGEPVNRHVVLEMCRTLAAQVQVGGGVRGAADAEELLDNGAARVVLGTAAIASPELVAQLVARYPGRVAVGLDHRGSGAEVAVAGWERQGGAEGVMETMGRFDGMGVAAFVITAIDRDGMLSGPDVDGYATALAATDTPVVASGGVATVSHLRTLASLQRNGRLITGAIVGKAFAEGLLSVEEALEACEPSG